MLDFYFQDDAEYSVYKYFAKKSGNPIIAMPTGTGKSHVISNFVRNAMQRWPSQRFMCLTHVKELVKQNAQKLIDSWPQAPMGIYSAGLKQKDFSAPIIYGGIASVKNNVEKFGHRDIIFIDECHLVSPKAETTYRQVLDRLIAINPNLKVVGLTATYYRLGLGLLTDGGIFTDVCFDLTTVDAFNKLIVEGYLAPLIAKATHTVLDVSSVKIQGGEFVQRDLQKSVDKQDITYKALQEICEHGVDRRAWLIFATGVDHADHIAEMLNSFGIPCAAVHSKMPTKDRDQRIADFKAGKLRCLVNNNVLTTGFDHPPIDLIGMLRPTVSASLWVQMAGRGTRPYPGKDNCLLLDFAGNTLRLGPINDPRIPRKGSKQAGDAPVKICPECGVYNHLSVRNCVVCNFEFPTHEKIVAQSSELELLRDGVPVVETFPVDRVVYHLHKKQGAPDSMRVTYYSSVHAFKEWIHIERDGRPGRTAKDWWLQRYIGETTRPGEMNVFTVEAALSMTHLLTVPRRLRVWTNKKFPEILGYEF